MEPNNDGSNGGGGCYHPQLPNQPPRPPSPPPPENGIGGGVVPNSTITNSSSAVYTTTHSSAAAVESESVNIKRKRGRPRKYETPEQAAAAKRLSAAASSPKKRDAANGGVVSSSNKSQLFNFANLGQSFTPHIITVAAGEDVGQNIMKFMQQSKREICIISASGSVSNASLRQPATSGGNVTYEGRFDILSLSGSYIRTEYGGRTGGLSVCLSSSDGQIIGGGVGGPLTAAGTIQVIVGTFLIDSKTETDAKIDAASTKLPSPSGGTYEPSLSFRSPANSGFQMGSGGNPFLIQNRSMEMTPQHSMDWIGNMGHSMHQSPQNGDYDHIPD